jgi:hypothetical protein
MRESEILLEVSRQRGKSEAGLVLFAASVVVGDLGI